MKAVSTFEMSVYSYETTRRYTPEGCHLRTRRCENLKSHNRIVVTINVMLKRPCSRSVVRTLKDSQGFLTISAQQEMNIPYWRSQYTQGGWITVFSPRASKYPWRSRPPQLLWKVRLAAMTVSAFSSAGTKNKAVLSSNTAFSFNEK
jgi:hypothetical protein